MVSMASFGANGHGPNLPKEKKGGPFPIFSIWRSEHSKKASCPSPCAIHGRTRRSPPRAGKHAKQCSKWWRPSKGGRPGMAPRHGGRELLALGSGSRTVSPLRGSLRQDGYFAAHVTLGTPPQQAELVVDTGSHIINTACEGCKTACGKHKNAPYSPGASSTSSSVPCDSDACFGKRCYGIGRACSYDVRYEESSGSKGHLVTDTFRMGNLRANLTFGCALRQTGLLKHQSAGGSIDVPFWICLLGSVRGGVGQSHARRWRPCPGAERGELIGPNRASLQQHFRTLPRWGERWRRDALRPQQRSHSSPVRDALLQARLQI